MKKLMIALVAVASAIAVNASTFNWSTATGKVVMPETTTGINGGTAYLFDAATITQSALITALQDGTYASLEAAFSAKGITTAPTTTFSSLGVGSASTNFEYNDGATTHTYFYALVSDSVKDAVFVSSTKDAQGSVTQGDTTPIAFANQAAASRAAIKTEAANAAGWYQTVPEPTSGLLLLLGVAGLALRRRRA